MRAGAAATALTLALAWGGAARAHNRSEGRSSFIIDDAGTVDVLIAIDFLDVPELCNADLLVEPARLDDMRARLNACLVRDMPLVLRIAGDGKPCPVVFDKAEEKRVDGKGNGTLSIYARAQCEALPGTLVIDWGLFAGSSLDHVSIAKIEEPHAEPKLAMLSKRSPRLTIALARDHTVVVVAAVAVALLLAAAALVIFRRARKRG